MRAPRWTPRRLRSEEPEIYTCNHCGNYWPFYDNFIAHLPWCPYDTPENTPSIRKLNKP